MSCHLLPKDRLEIGLVALITEFAAERSKIAMGRGFWAIVIMAIVAIHVIIVAIIVVMIVSVSVSSSS